MEAIGSWLDGSGWAEMYMYSKVTTDGKPESFLNCSGKAGIKQSRYAHQVTLSVLTKLMRQSFESQSEFDDYSAWRKDVEENHH